MKKKKTNESQAEKFSGRRGEILRTERRNSPDGAENGSRARKRGGFAEAASQLKLKVGGWVQVSLEFSVNDRKTQDGRDFKAQRVRIINISPLWGHEETADKAF